MVIFELDWWPGSGGPDWSGFYLAGTRSRSGHWWCLCGRVSAPAFSEWADRKFPRRLKFLNNSAAAGRRQTNGIKHRKLWSKNTNKRDLKAFQTAVQSAALGQSVWLTPPPPLPPPATLKNAARQRRSQIRSRTTSMKIPAEDSKQ